MLSPATPSNFTRARIQFGYGKPCRARRIRANPAHWSVLKLAREHNIHSYAIIANKELGPGPKLVYSMLLSYAAANEAATNNRLAADLAVSPRSVRNYIAALKDAGLVEVQHHPGKPRSFKLAAAL